MSATDVTRKWADAVNRHDAAAFAALYAPNAIVSDPQYSEALEGRDAIQRDISDFFTAFPDLHVALRSVMVRDDTYATEGTFRGTHSGPLLTPSGEIPASGKQLQLDAAGFYRVDAQGRILEERRYYDLSGFFAQLEVAP